MAILFQSVYQWAPLNFTTGSGTSAQAITGAVLNVGGPNLSGKPFYLVCQGYVKAHGATQTLAVGFQGRAYATSAFSGTQLGTGTASGTLTAGTVYPFLLTAELFADNTSGILSGFYTVTDGVTPTTKANTVVANLLTSITFGQSTLSNPGNPIGSTGAGNQAPALQFVPTVTNSVSDTSEVVTITSFYVSQD